MRTLSIRRRGRRRGYRRQSGVYTHPAQVPGVIVRIKDRGRPGLGPKVIPELKKGAMTNIATGLGYIKRGRPSPTSRRARWITSPGTWLIQWDRAGLWDGQCPGGLQEESERRL